MRARVERFVRARWGALENYRDADIDRFVAAVVPVVTGGQLAVAQLTDAHLAAVEGAAFGRQVRPVGVPAGLVTDEAMRGVPADVVYGRAGPTVWTSLSKGNPLDVAAAAGLARVVQTAVTDLQLARTHAARHVLSSKGTIVVGYHRVLLGSNPCALCQEAASKRYATGDLMPCHPGCACGVAPVYRNGKQVAPDLADVDESTTAVRTHGELGPVLTRSDHSFLSVDDLDL